MPRFAPADGRFDIGVIVFPTDDLAVWGQVASSAHYHWTLSYAATTRDDPSYAPKRVSDTFPWVLGPTLDVGATSAFEAALEKACQQSGGLRPVMNCLNSASAAAPYVTDLRDLFVEMDREVFHWFGWRDLDPRYDIRVRNNLTRFTVDTKTQAEVLRRLLDENLQRSGQRPADVERSEGLES